MKNFNPEKTYTDWFSAETMEKLSDQINEEAESRNREIVSVSLSQDRGSWFYALVVFKKG